MPYFHEEQNPIKCFKADLTLEETMAKKKARKSKKTARRKTKRAHKAKRPARKAMKRKAVKRKTVRRKKRPSAAMMRKSMTGGEMGECSTC